MNILDINGWEFVIIVVLALVLIGPERMPEYAAKLGRFVRQLRGMAEGAKASLRDQMGPEFDDIDWKTYDPRQYDPRRIVRDALLDDSPLDSTASAPVEEPFTYSPQPERYDPNRPTPYDLDAT